MWRAPVGREAGKDWAMDEVIAVISVDGGYPITVVEGGRYGARNLKVSDKVVAWVTPSTEGNWWVRCFGFDHGFHHEGDFKEVQTEKPVDAFNVAKLHAEKVSVEMYCRDNNITQHDLDIAELDAVIARAAAGVNDGV